MTPPPFGTFPKIHPFCYDGHYGLDIRTHFLSEKRASSQVKRAPPCPDLHQKQIGILNIHNPNILKANQNPLYALLYYYNYAMILNLRTSIEMVSSEILHWKKSGSR